MKRSLDMILAAAGLILLAPLFVVVACWVKVSSPGSVFFRQERMGRGFRPFWIYKFRTMVADAPARGAAITVGQDPRITPVGRLLRITKIDELPQLLNVLKGEMSLVGPRPEVRRYVELFHDDYAEILQVRPGITDLASITFRDEAAVLAAARDPEDEYRQHVLPEKIRLAKSYVRQQSLRGDLHIICLTLFKLLGDRLPVVCR